MSRELTWKNIDAPNLVPAATMMNRAFDRFNSTISGIGDFFKQHTAEQDAEVQRAKDYYTNQAVTEFMLKARNSPDTVDQYLDGITYGDNPTGYLLKNLVVPGAQRASAMAGTEAPTAPVFDVNKLTTAIMAAEPTIRANLLAKDTYLEGKSFKVDAPRLNAHLVQIAGSKDKNALLAIGTPEYLSGTFQSRGAQEQTAKAVAARLQALREEERQAARDADARATNAAQRRAYEAQLADRAEAKKRAEAAALAAALEKERMAGINKRYSPLGVVNTASATLSKWLPGMVATFHGKPEDLEFWESSKFQVTDRDVADAMQAYDEGFVIDVPDKNGKKTKLTIPFTQGSMERLFTSAVAYGDEEEFKQKLDRTRTAMEVLYTHLGAKPAVIMAAAERLGVAEEIPDATSMLLHAARQSEELGAKEQGAIANLDPAVAAQLLQGYATQEAINTVPTLLGPPGSKTPTQPGKNPWLNPPTK